MLLSVLVSILHHFKAWYNKGVLFLKIREIQRSIGGVMINKYFLK